MKEKYDILNTIEITDDIVIIVAKKHKEIEKKCGICNCCKKISDTNEYYCTRYRALVDPKDNCIEVGM